MLPKWVHLMFFSLFFGGNLYSMCLIALLMREEAKAVEEGRPSVSVLQKYPHATTFLGIVCFVGIDLMPFILGVTIDDFSISQLEDMLVMVRDQ